MSEAHSKSPFPFSFTRDKWIRKFDDSELKLHRIFKNCQKKKSSNKPTKDEENISIFRLNHLMLIQRKTIHYFWQPKLHQHITLTYTQREREWEWERLNERKNVKKTHIQLFYLCKKNWNPIDTDMHTTTDITSYSMHHTHSITRHIQTQA